MLVTVVLLGVALIPTGDSLWFTGDAYDSHETATQAIAAPALCYIQRLGSSGHYNRLQPGSPSGISMIVSLFVLVSSYLTRLIKFSDTSTGFARRWLREKPSQLLKSIRNIALRHLEGHEPKSRTSLWTVAYIFNETLYVLLKILFDSSQSMLWEVRTVSVPKSHHNRTSLLISYKIIWLIFAIAWGTKNLFLTRAWSTMNAENTWRFGQMFPMVLLALPLLSTLETYYGE